MRRVHASGGSSRAYECESSGLLDWMDHISGVVLNSGGYVGDFHSRAANTDSNWQNDVYHSPAHIFRCLCPARCRSLDGDVRGCVLPAELVDITFWTFR